MRIVLAGLVVAAIVLMVSVTGAAHAAAHPRFARCIATTDTQGGAGLAAFVGNCDGAKSKLRVLPFKVTGKIGGLPVKFKRDGIHFSGTVGKAYGTFVLHDRAITGTFARHRVRLTAHRTAVWGRIGTLRIGCTVAALSPLGERISCTGKHGGAGILVPYLALLYAAP
jgi:hypothetical protein